MNHTMGNKLNNLSVKNRELFFTSISAIDPLFLNKEEIKIAVDRIETLCSHNCAEVRMAAYSSISFKFSFAKKFDIIIQRFFVEADDDCIKTLVNSASFIGTHAEYKDSCINFLDTAAFNLELFEEVREYAKLTSKLLKGELNIMEHSKLCYQYL